MSDPDVDRVQAAIDLLSEHFDTVQIFVTVYKGDDDSTTHTIARGNGNWYARYGQVASWVVRQDEGTRVDARKDNEQ